MPDEKRENEADSDNREEDERNLFLSDINRFIRSTSVF